MKKQLNYLDLNSVSDPFHYINENVTLDIDKLIEVISDITEQYTGNERHLLIHCAISSYSEKLRDAQKGYTIANIINYLEEENNKG